MSGRVLVELKDPKLGDGVWQVTAGSWQILLPVITIVGVVVPSLSQDTGVEPTDDSEAYEVEDTDLNVQAEGREDENSAPNIESASSATRVPTTHMAEETDTCPSTSNQILSDPKPASSCAISDAQVFAAESPSTEEDFLSLSLSDPEGSGFDSLFATCDEIHNALSHSEDTHSPDMQSLPTMETSSRPPTPANLCEDDAQIFVQTFGSSADPLTIHIDKQCMSTVRDVKLRIQEEKRIPANECWLWYNGDRLTDDDAALATVGVGLNATLVFTRQRSLVAQEAYRHKVLRKARIELIELLRLLYTLWACESIRDD